MACAVAIAKSDKAWQKEKAADMPPIPLPEDRPPPRRKPHVPQVAGGAPHSYAQRRAAGRVLVTVWLDEIDIARLDYMTGELALSRTDVIRESLEAYDRIVYAASLTRPKAPHVKGPPKTKAVR